MVLQDRDNVYLKCLKCRREYQVQNIIDLLTPRCPHCGGIVTIEYRKRLFRVNPREKGIWRYSFMLPQPRNRISLGEGLTRVTEVDGVLVKNEKSNPTGSYADRASALVASFLADLGRTPVAIEYAQEFTRSIVTYVMRTLEIPLKIVSESLLSVDPDDAMLFASMGIEVSSRASGGVFVPYFSPLAIEGLKTIILELLEQRVEAEHVVVPAKTGALALSIWKGIKDLEEAGIDASIKVVAAVPKGHTTHLLADCGGIGIVEVPVEELYESFRDLTRRGFAIKPLAALSYHVARNLGKAVAVVTMGYKPRATRKTSNVKKQVLDVLSKRPLLTAYEIWKENPIYTLRAVYKAVKSLEESQVICFEIVSRGGRKVKLYKLCR